MPNSKKNSKQNSGETEKFPGYPIYPESEDIYSKAKEETEIDPEFLNQKKPANETPGTLNEKDFKDDVSGNDLDIPGSELDDTQEDIGSEDEENNHYSLGDNK